MIKKKYPANTPEIKKLSQQAIKGVSIQKITKKKSTKNHYASTEDQSQ